MKQVTLIQRRFIGRSVLAAIDSAIFLTSLQQRRKIPPSKAGFHIARLAEQF